MKERDWDYPNRIEESYRRSLTDLFNELVSLVLGIEVTDPYQLLDILKAFYNGNFFRDQAPLLASRMITALRTDSAATWREAATIGTRGREIRQALVNELKGPVGFRVQALVDENQKLISTFADDMENRVADFIKEETLKGRRAADITDDLMTQFPDVTKPRLSLIARTETSKASTALTRARSEMLDLNWYIWITAKDGRVRKSHRAMNGILVNWNDPPSPEALAGADREYGQYQAGEIFNCRCYPRPLLSLDDIQFPAKVYYGGRIITMRRAEFARISGMEARQAA